MTSHDTNGAPLWFRHASHLVPVMVFTAFVAVASAMSVGSLGTVGILFVALATVNAASLALTSWVPMLGMLVAAMGLLRPVRGLAPPFVSGRARTAVLIPIYEEDPVAVFAGVATMRASLPRGGTGDVDIFILSDTRTAEIAEAEAMQFAGLRARILAAEGEPCADSDSRELHYRHREKNIRRKAGNVEDFCVRWGGAYDFMVVLDADSLMVGDSIAHMIGLMEANPRAGIVQTMCYPVGKDTLFARFQQFSARLYGPLLAQGQSFWQGGHGSWWGHNAIIRVDAFMRHCGLPELPGRAPLGGDILCHDTVEAALMLRAGWEVWLAPEIAGSFEQTPTNLVDHLARDRRWCQGNMQHMKVLRADGLRLASVLHLGVGILHYLSAPLFVLFLVAAVALGSLGAPMDATQAAWSDAMMWAVFGLLFAPKILAVGWTLADRGRRRDFGGTVRLLVGAVAEQAIGMLVGPPTLCCYVAFLWNTFSGRVVRWDAQNREDRGVAWREAAGRLGLPSAIGAAAILLGGGLNLAWWPLLTGLVLVVPVAVFTSRPGVGLWLKAAGLFVTPEETRPPVEFVRLAREVGLALLRHDGPGVTTALPRETYGVMPSQMLNAPRRNWAAPIPALSSDVGD